MHKNAEETSLAIAKGAAQITAKLEQRVQDIELELNRTIQTTDEVHKTITKGERKVKELLFQQAVKSRSTLRGSKLRCKQVSASESLKKLV